jgi:hypothetical protein
MIIIDAESTIRTYTGSCHLSLDFASEDVGFLDGHVTGFV